MFNFNNKHRKINWDKFKPMTHNGAYVLGFISANSKLPNNATFIEITQKLEDGKIIQDISKLLYSFQDLAKTSRGTKKLTIYDKEFIEFLSILNLKWTKEGKDLNILSKIDVKFWSSFICGFFDRGGLFDGRNDSPEISFLSDSQKILGQISDHFNLNISPKNGKITVSGFRALDICAEMYKDVSIHDVRKYESYQRKMNWQPKGVWRHNDSFWYKRASKDAKAPYKKHATDSGYDVSAIELEHVKDNIYKAHTHLAVRPPNGWYFDLVGRSSLASKGWHFLGGVGIIDRAYTGELIMWMQKLDDRELPDLPFRCGQIIPRPIVHMNFKEVKNLDESARGSTGFGSTDIII